MQFTAQQIATLIQGRLEGDPEAKVSDVAKIEEATSGALSFISNPKYEEYLYTTQASIIIINESLEITKPVQTTVIRVKDAYMAFALLLEKYSEIISGGTKTGIEQPSFIAATAKVGKDVYVGAFSYIGENAVIADGVRTDRGSTLFPRPSPCA